MRYLLILLTVGALAAGCSSLPLPRVGGGVPQTCTERLTEASCKAGQRCRWINASKRLDGTYATAHCDGA